MSYKIGSFNMCNCNFRSDKESAKSFEMIASIIDKEDFDIVAMQEVLNENVFKDQLARLLPQGKKNWKYRWIQPIQYNFGEMGDRRGEGYAYLWNANRIDLVHSEDEYEGTKISEPTIWRQYSGRKYQKIKREPYYARFSPSGLPGGSFFELRLINTHIIYGKNVGERIEEFQRLVENVYVNIANRRYGNNMPAYTILLGDYNLTSVQLHAKDSLTVEKIFIGANRDENIKRNIITVQDLPTTLNRVKRDDGSYGSTDYTPNDYDHFSFTREMDEKMTLLPERIDAVRKYYGDTDEPLESHRRAADILNQTPDKADLITAAILNYHGEDAREGIFNLDSLRPWIEEVIQREVLFVMKKMPDPDKEMISVERETQDNIKVMDLSEDHEDEFDILVRWNRKYLI